MPGSPSFSDLQYLAASRRAVAAAAAAAAAQQHHQFSAMKPSVSASSIVPTNSISGVTSTSHQSELNQIQSASSGVGPQSASAMCDFHPTYRIPTYVEHLYSLTSPPSASFALNSSDYFAQQTAPGSITSTALAAAAAAADFHHLQTSNSLLCSRANISRKRALSSSPYSDSFDINAMIRFSPTALLPAAAAAFISESRGSSIGPNGGCTGSYGHLSAGTISPVVGLQNAVAAAAAAATVACSTLSSSNGNSAAMHHFQTQLLRNSGFGMPTAGPPPPHPPGALATAAAVMAARNQHLLQQSASMQQSINPTSTDDLMCSSSADAMMKQTSVPPPKLSAQSVTSSSAEMPSSSTNGCRQVEADSTGTGNRARLETTKPFKEQREESTISHYIKREPIQDPGELSNYG